VLRERYAAKGVVIVSRYLLARLECQMSDRKECQ
jgi:hypothetical protein